jgi:hypothetical protein
VGFLFVCFIIVDFYFHSYFLSVLSTSPSLSFHPYSHPLHFPSFSCAIIHCFPSQLLFLPLLIHSLPCIHLSLQTSPNLSPHYPSLLHTHTWWPTYYTNFTQPQPPAIPDTSTLHYNRNTPKHTQGPKNPAVFTPLPPLTYPTSCLPFYCHPNQFPKCL